MVSFIVSFSYFLYYFDMEYETCILLNAGTKTRKAFTEGLTDTKLKRYQTPRLALHITKDGLPFFLHRNKPIDWNGACVYIRLCGTDEQFCGILYDYFLHMNIPANDPIHSAYTHSAEKISQMLKLALNGVPIPESFIVREESFARNRSYIETHTTFPLIYKTDGRQGEQVFFVSSKEELQKHIDTKKPYELALIQPFIDNTFDTRTIVAFGEVLGTIKRTRTKGYLNNVSQGARVEKYELTDAEKLIALNAASVCGIDVAGIDMIHTPEGPVVLEVNKSPQVQGFESVYDFKVFSRVASLMMQKL
jgi:RimK family alpha-L-glutamate ligase